jgi:hypothetical protein
VIGENNLKSISKSLWFLEKLSFSLAIRKPEIIVDSNLNKYVMIFFVGNIFILYFIYGLYYRLKIISRYILKIKSIILINVKKSKVLYLSNINYNMKHAQPIFKILSVEMLSLKSILKVST